MGEGYDRVYFTRNGGAGWTPKAVDPAAFYTGIAAAGRSVWLAGDNGAVLASGAGRLTR